MRNLDCIVLGVGGVGAAALYSLARRGVRALGIDRFAPGHDQGSSHGETRIIRQAYFEHPDYVPLLKRAYELWSELETRRGESLYRETGLLQVGPPAGVIVPGVLKSARLHSLEVEELAPGVAERRFPGFRIPGDLRVVFEPQAGYLRVEECVRAHAAEAVQLGAELLSGEAVEGWRADGNGFEVRTKSGLYRAASLIVTAGAWAPELLRDLGVRFEVRRKAAFWHRTSQDYRSAPCFFFELPEGLFYGFPELEGSGLKAAKHTGGDVVVDPLKVDRAERPQDLADLRSFLSKHLSGVSSERLRHSVCMYTMTPDEHFVVDLHPSHSRLAFAAGLSGHGFKFTSVLGEVLSELAIDGRTKLPIDFLQLARPGLRGQ